MSSVNFMEKLLDGVDVEWKALGNIAKVQRGASPRPIAQYITDDEDGVPWIKIGDTSSGLKYVHKTAQKISKEGAKKSRILKKGDFIISNSMSFGRPYILNIDGAIHDGWASISAFEEALNSDFLYHYLSSSSVQNYWLSKINSGSVSNLNADIIKTLLIPVPCPENPKKSLEIQTEIVRILDAFTSLTTELTTELTARKKQYNYYRDKLLSFEEGEVEWKTLGELTSLITKGTTPKQYTDKGIAFIKTEAFDGTHININKLSFIDEETHNTELKRSILNKNDILITIAGATIGKCAIVPKEVLPANTNQALAIIRLNDYVNLKYVFHLIRSNYLKKYIEQNIKGSAQPNLNLEQLNNFYIPYPPSEEQARIVALLDKFDALTTSITEGLPREIELRQKQYEYYRDLLLSFPKSDTEVAA